MCIRKGENQKVAKRRGKGREGGERGREGGGRGREGGGKGREKRNNEEKEKEEGEKEEGEKEEGSRKKERRVTLNTAAGEYSMLRSEKNCTISAKKVHSDNSNKSQICLKLLSTYV